MTVFFDRRALLKSSAIGGCFLALGCKTLGDRSALSDESAANDANDSNLRVRKRWEPGKGEDFKKQYAQAVDWLKANDQQSFPETDPRSFLSWNRFVDIHDSSCPHGNWLFAPWHRLYLYYFEAACQLALQDKTFALPYWDWTLDPLIPEEFFSNASLSVDNRAVKSGDKISEEFIGQDVMNSVYALSDFYAFFSRPTDYKPRFRGPAGASTSATGAFENNPHNNVHRFLGGWMGSNKSPTDPIFWMHHGNIDRIWRQFQRLNPDLLPTKITFTFAGTSAVASRDDVAEAYMATELRLLRSGNVEQPPLPMMGQDQSLAAKMSVKAVQDIKAFGYIYDTDLLPAPTVIRDQKAAEGEVLTPGKAIKQVSKQVVIKPGGSRYGYAMIGNSVPSANRITTTIDVTDMDSQNLLKVFKKNSSDVAYFIAGKLVPPTDAFMKESLLIRFFIVASDGVKDFDAFSQDAYKRPEYVGSYSFFGADHIHGEHASDPSKATAVEFSSVLKRQLGSDTIKTITLVAAAMNIRTMKPLDYFAFSSKTELALEFQSQDNIKQ